MITKGTLAEALADNIGCRLTAARAVVSVTAQTLDHGETDLEIHAADALKPAAEALDEILNDVAALRLDSEPAKRLSTKARLVLVGDPREYLVRARRLRGGVFVCDAGPSCIVHAGLLCPPLAYSSAL